MQKASFSKPPTTLPAWMPWVIGGIFIAFFSLRDFLQSSNGVIEHAVYWGRDFINVWTGGTLVREGRVDILYDLKAYASYQQSIFGDIGPHNYSYPPVSFPLAALFSMLPYGVALYAWLLLTGALFIYAAKSFWPARAGWPVLAVVTPAALVNIWAGHYGFLIGALFLLGWHRLEHKPIQAGIFFGLMLIKPHLAILVPLALVLRGDWRAIASAGLTVAGLVVTTTLIYGWQPWSDYVFRTIGVQAAMIDANGMLFEHMSPSAMTAVLHLGGSWSAALFLQLVLAAFGLWLITTAISRGAPTQHLALLCGTCTFLVLPYAFNYDLVVVMIGALTVMTREDVSGPDFRLATLGFMSPQLGMVLSAFGLPIMWLMLAGLAWAQYRVAIRGTSASVSVPAVRASEAVTH